MTSGRPPYDPIAVSGLNVQDELDGFHPIGYSRQQKSTVLLSDGLLGGLHGDAEAAQAAAESAAASESNASAAAQSASDDAAEIRDILSEGFATAADGALARGALQPDTGVSRVATFASAPTAAIPDAVQRVFVEDRRAHFRRVESEPAHPLKFQNAGGWWEFDEPTVTPANAGAAGDGSPDDLAALAAADGCATAQNKALVISRHHRISGDIALAADVTFRPGGMLLADPGKTVTVDGSLTADQSPIFGDDGAIVFGSGVGDKIQVAWFGALPDGNDQSERINKAILSSVNRTLVFRRDRTYRSDKMIKVNVPINIEGRGAKLDLSGITDTGHGGLGSNIRVCFAVEGLGRLASSLLASDVLAGARSIPVQDGAAFSANDYIQIGDDSVYNYNGTYSVKRAEIRRIYAVDGNTLHLEEPLIEGYSASSAGTVWKLDLLDGVTIADLKFDCGAAEADYYEAVRLNWTKGARLEGCSFKNVDLYCARLFNCIDADVEGCYFRGVPYTGVGTAFYGLAVMNGTHRLSVRACKGSMLRHLVVISSTQLERGQSFFITASDCHIVNSMTAVIGYESFAFENHGFGRFVSFVNCTADGCFAGFNIEAGDTSVIGCTVRNFTYAGVMVSDGRSLGNIQVAGNNFSGCLPGVNIVGKGAVSIRAPANSSLYNLLIDSNTISDMSPSGTQNTNGVFLSINSSGSIWHNIRVSGNAIYSASKVDVGSETGLAVGIDARIPRAIINGNTVTNYVRGIHASVAELAIVGNDFTLTGKSSGDNYGAIRGFSGMVGCLIEGNRFRDYYYAIRLPAGANDNQIVGNRFWRVDTQVSDAGSNNTISDSVTMAA